MNLYRTKTSIVLLGMLAVLYGLNSLGQLWNLYYIFPRYDIMMHFLGGVILGLMAVMVVRDRDWSRREKIAFVFFFGIVGGIGWEIFEYLLDQILHVNLQVSFIDTLSDMTCDTLGALFVGFVYRSIKKI